MKKLIFIFCTLIPILSFGQTDKRYLEPLPTKDGKITFESQIKAPSLSQQELYDILYKWSDERFKPNEKMNARIIYTDKDKGMILSSAEEYIVFSSSAFSLDRTRIYFHLLIECSPENIKYQMSKIRYWYDENNDGGEKFTAEEWISDKDALNKAKTRLLPYSGKFRRKTIDLNDDLVKSINDLIAKAVFDKRSKEMDNKQPMAVQQVAPTQQAIQTQQVAPVQQSAEQSGNIAVADIKEVKQNISKEDIIAQANRITITSGNDEKFEIGKESWGGFGKLFNKDVAFCLIDAQKTIANMLLSQNDKYTISFYLPGKSEEALVIKCRKISVQSINGEEANKMNSNNLATNKYNMYVVEIEQ